MDGVMSELKASALKVFLPAKNFERSEQFYRDPGFTLQWTSGDGSLAYFQVGPAKFLLSANAQPRPIPLPAPVTTAIFADACMATMVPQRQPFPTQDDAEPARRSG